MVEGVNSVSAYNNNNILIGTFNAQAMKLLKSDGSLDVSALNKLLNNGAYNSLYADISETYQSLQNDLAQMMNIGINMSKVMSATTKVFRGDTVLGELKKFEETLSQSLLSNTENMLIEKFENNDLCLKKQY